MMTLPGFGLNPLLKWAGRLTGTKLVRRPYWGREFFLAINPFFSGLTFIDSPGKLTVSFLCVADDVGQSPAESVKRRRAIAALLFY